MASWLSVASVLAAGDEAARARAAAVAAPPPHDPAPRAPLPGGDT